MAPHTTRLIYRIENQNMIKLKWASTWENMSSGKVQTPLRIRTVWPAPLLFAYWKVSYQTCSKNSQIRSQAYLTCKTIQVSASTLCQFWSKASWRVICPSNTLYLKQTTSIQNTAHKVFACSFRHHTSASNLIWNVLNDSDFKAWVKYFGMPCSGPDTLTFPFTKLWSSLVTSLIEG